MNLYYTGLDDKARIREQEDAPKEYAIGRDHTVEIPVSIPAQGFGWWVVE